MKTVVCVKQVDGELNPFDACALECALSIEDNDITVISMGRPDVKDTLYKLTRLGINRAILLTDNAFAGADTLATAYVLSSVIKKIAPDLVLCGRQSVDGDTAQTGACISGMLCYNIVTNVLSIDAILKTGMAFTTRSGFEKKSFPLVATVERINTLRFPSIRSKPFEVEVKSADDIGVDKAKCGLCGSPTRVIKTFESSLGLRKCTFIEKETLQSIIKKSLIKQKIQMPTENVGAKLKRVYAIGNTVLQKAREIADEVVVVDSYEPNEIVNCLRQSNAEFALFPATLFGRKIAPIVQAKLNTGLCADCTRLETDGNQLYMYRPAFGGTLIAKIECKTLPVMATVRVAEKQQSGVIVSAGLGAANCIGALQKLCKDNGYEFCASRGLVDKTGLAYEYQVGLTGRTVAPKVYIACGISGAVHHTCAIEGASTVIAINTDKNARIFDYADYGVIGDINEIYGRI